VLVWLVWLVWLTGVYRLIAAGGRALSGTCRPRQRGAMARLPVVPHAPRRSAHTGTTGPQPTLNCTEAAAPYAECMDLLINALWIAGVAALGTLCTVGAVAVGLRQPNKRARRRRQPLYWGR
jgi:hypothetical protein